MSVDKLVDSTQLDSDLTSVANAIRTRGGTSSQLAFPNGFVSAVQEIGNTYSAGDEGKVVSNGALVAQSSQSIDTNGIYDTTLKNEVVVNVSGSPSWVSFISSFKTVYGTNNLINSAQSVDIYIPNLSDMNQSFYYANSSTCKNIKVKSDVAITGMNQAFLVTDLPTDGVITIDADLSQCTNYTNAFAVRQTNHHHVSTIIANLDFSSLTTNTTNVFNNNKDIQNLTFVPNTLGVDFSIPVAENLTNASIVSIANGLKQVAKTFTLHNTVKAKLSNIIGTITNNGTYDIFTEDAGGTDNLLDFITTTKGWTLA